MLLRRGQIREREPASEKCDSTSRRRPLAVAEDIMLIFKWKGLSGCVVMNKQCKSRESRGLKDSKGEGMGALQAEANPSSRMGKL